MSLYSVLCYRTSISTRLSKIRENSFQKLKFVTGAIRCFKLSLTCINVDISTVILSQVRNLNFRVWWPMARIIASLLQWQFFFTSWNELINVFYGYTMWNCLLLWSCPCFWNSKRVPMISKLLLSKSTQCGTVYVIRMISKRVPIISKLSCSAMVNCSLIDVIHTLCIYPHASYSKYGNSG